MEAGSRLDEQPPPALRGNWLKPSVDQTVDLASLRVAARTRVGSGQFDAFLHATTPAEQLHAWFGSAAGGLSADEAARLLNSAVAEIDRVVGRQLNAILHHPEFQKLEASWRGIDYLTQRIDAENTDSVRLRLLSVTWREIERDLERAIEFDQSQLFKKIYDEEFGSPGGSPYGLLIGDYQVEPRPRDGHPHDDIEMLRRLSGVAAAAFCPLVVGASPGMFGLRRYSDFERVRSIGSVFTMQDYLKWRAFRDTPDSKFVGLVAPRVLMRPPYRSAYEAGTSFPFREEVGGANPDRYLWGNAAYAFGEVVIRAFAQSGWLAEIRGVQRGVEGGGIVTGLARTSYRADREGVAELPPVDASFSEDEEAELHELGFLSLVHCKGTPYAAFYGSPSTHSPATYTDADATQSARFSAMLNYTLCVSRFAHYIKVLGRNKVGSMGSPEELQSFLHQWLMQYVTPGADASPRMRAKMPLRAAEVEVLSQSGQAGSYRCVLRLMPHYQLDELAATLRLDTTLKSPETTSA